MEHKIYCTDKIWLLEEYCNKLMLRMCQCLSYAGLPYMYWHQNKLTKVGNCIIGVWWNCVVGFMPSTSLLSPCTIVQLSMANSDKMWTFAFPIHFLMSDNLCATLHVSNTTLAHLLLSRVWLKLLMHQHSLMLQQTCYSLKTIPPAQGCINNQRPCITVLVTAVYTLNAAHGTPYVEC